MDTPSYHISLAVSVFFLVGLALDFSFIFKKNRKPLAGIPTNVPWNWADFALVTLFFLLFQQAMVMFFDSMIKTWTPVKIYKDPLIWFSSFIVGLATFIFLIRFLRIRYSVGLKELGLARPIQLRWFGTGFFYYCGAIPVLVFVGIITKVLGDYFGIPLEPQAPLKMLKKETLSLNIIIISLFIVGVAPFFEEIFFRGFVYPLIKKFLGYRWAMILSSLFFAMLHFSFLAFLPITCIGLFLAYLYEKTGSLFSSIFFHSLNNLIAVLIVIFVLK